MKKYLFLLLIGIFVSCSADNNLAPAEGVNIRVINLSKYDFKDVHVNTSNMDRALFGLNHGKASPYILVDQAYAYAFIEVKIDGQTYTLQPIDYVGESPLPNGYYSYIINATTSPNRYEKLRLTFTKDQ